jgi:hypothetical protein
MNLKANRGISPTNIRPTKDQVLAILRNLPIKMHAPYIEAWPQQVYKVWQSMSNKKGYLLKTANK